MSRKVFVGVNVDFDAQGRMCPLAIMWEDGRVFAVDRVTDMRKAVSLKAGGVGLRYTCEIRGKSVYLYYEEPRWFMEGKERAAGAPPRAAGG